LIALSLVASAALRLGAGPGLAIANELAEAGIDSAVSCSTDTDVAAVLELLREREETLAAREAALADRSQAIAVAEAQVRKNLDALEGAEAELERMIALSAEAAEDDLSQLTSVYENMKPKQAAQVFAAMDPEFAAGFLSRMRTDAAARIMAGLEPETAYAISVLLAGRNATAPTQ
tara:strand:+ start:22752 stop:23279 length:528 start_codon:yes stop_codon:yes gene_type:complete